jgi:hypothetical protein
VERSELMKKLEQTEDTVAAFLNEMGMLIDSVSSLDISPPYL